jgi:excisionase family DNA binding protein
MTVRDVAAYLNVNEKTVYRLAQRRELPGFKVAGTWRFQRGDLDAWIEAQKKAPNAEPPSLGRTRRRLRTAG